MAGSAFVVQSRQKSDTGTLPPIGTRREIEAALAALNTAPEAPGGQVLYGPGFEMHFPPEQDPVTQILVAETDESICRLTIWLIARQMHWRLVDASSGEVFTP
jgi:hypothetical protein